MGKTMLPTYKSLGRRWPKSHQVVVKISTGSFSLFAGGNIFPPLLIPPLPSGVVLDNPLLPSYNCNCKAIVTRGLPIPQNVYIASLSGDARRESQRTCPTLSRTCPTSQA